MINRELTGKIEQLSKKFPVVGLIGPRQSGKTTLLKSLFSGFRYYNLESPDTLAFVESDPGGFIRGQSQIIIDEIQRFPSLLSYIQAVTDERQKTGDFIVSGSENLLVSEKINQSLAGRAAYATLLPLSLGELALAKSIKKDINEQIVQGFYPAVYARHIEPGIYYDQYTATYVERDLKNLSHINNLSQFRKFLALLAGRIGQVVNRESLANDVGVSAATIENWFSLLEASYIIIRLQPYYHNFGKRHIKSPKIYFTDTGLACYLLGITNAGVLARHYLIGGLFENLCIMELQKYLLNHFTGARLYFFRDSNGNEVDLIIDNGTERIPVEIKSSATFSSEFLKGLKFWNTLAGAKTNGFVIYTGHSTGHSMDETAGFSLLNWKDLSALKKHI
jgi:predicted AAA+ superfamily ATPase